jgi:hypothetical protein
MSVFSDGRTIIGDGSSTDPKFNLATASVDTIAKMQDYDGMATVIQVADTYQGGTFHYSDENPFISGAFTFNGVTITPLSGHPNIFKTNQTVYISGTSTPNYDGKYTVTSPNSTTFNIVRSFATENHVATISILPFQANLGFSCDSDPVTPKVTISNRDYATTPSAGFLQNGFRIAQSITVTGAGNYNRTFTIATVNEDTITAFVSESISGSGDYLATLTDSTTYTAILGFNSGGTALQIINDNASGLKMRFYANQNIQVSGTALNDGVYKVSTINASGTQLTIASTFPVTRTQTATITTTDGGLTFPAIKKGSGMWRRQYDPKDGLNVTWFGAKGNALRQVSGNWYSSYINSTNNTPANDDTRSIQQALNVAASIRLAINKVVIPPGMYLHSTLYVPAGVLLTGTGAIVESLGIATSRLVMKAGGGDSLRFVSTGVGHATTSRRFWYGGVTNLSFLGEPTNKTGWAISFKDPTIDNPTNSIAPQDMNFFENLHMRGYPEGGMNFPDCAVPLNVRNIKAMVLGGPAIFISNSKASSGQSINLDNVSCDHNVGGGIWLDKLDDRVNVVITNLKSEGGQNNAFPGYPNAQPNAVICTDCLNTPVLINGASHQNVTADFGVFGGNPTLLKGADAGKVNADGNPYFYIIVNLPGHGLIANDKVKFITTGVMPTSITWSQVYYVLPVDTDNFMIVDTESGGLSRALSATQAEFDAQSGIHTLYKGFDNNYLTPGDLISIETKLANSPEFTIGSADISLTGSALAIGDSIKFYTNGVLPYRFIAGQIYYVIAVGTGTFQVAATSTGSVPVVPAGTQSGTHTIYKQVNSGNLPRLSFVAGAIRVRDCDHGTKPLMIAKTEIPYGVSEGKFNIIQQLYKSNVTFAPSSSLSTPINLGQGTQPSSPKSGDFWYDGSTLKFATDATTIKSLPTIIDEPEKTYTGTITWAPAISPPPPATATIFPPSGTTKHSYQWTQVGKMVTVRFNLSYQTAGAGQTTCTILFPSDLPAPRLPNGFTTGHTLYAGSAGYLTGLANGIGTARCNIHSQGTTAFRLDIYFTAASPLAVLATVTYWVD